MPSAVNNSGKSSQIITTIIPALSSIPVMVAGDTFYLTLATAAVDIQPSKSARSTYSQGTGERMKDNPFTQLQVYNDSPNNVIISIYVGFGEYIDNRVILFDPLVFSVSYPTYPVPNAATVVNITDRSGQAITDQNGNRYLALYRKAIYFSNIDPAQVYTLADSGFVVGSVIAIQPTFNIVFEASGNFRVNIPTGPIGAPVNAYISEIYAAVVPTLFP